MPNVLVATSGSVASIKLNLLLQQLLSIQGFEVKVVVTESSKHFLDLKTDRDKSWIQVEEKKVEVFDDKAEWNTWNNIGDPVLHIELRRWADVFLLAPCSANTLAKIAGGISDNLLLSILRAWEINNSKKMVVLVPAMNTLMWEHPLTQIHLDFCKKMLKIQVIPPIKKLLACGDLGDGAMAEVSTIANFMKKLKLK